MLIDEQDANVLAVVGEAIESLFDCRVVRLRLDDEEIPLRVRGGGDVLERSVGA